jgi:DNA-binding beta-propeller fold protein YncE
MALAVAVAVVVVAFRSLPAPEQTTGPHVVTVLGIGGNPVDGVFAAGSLWVTDFDRRQVVRIDPADRKVIARIPLDHAPADLAGGDGSVWARGLAGNDLARIWRIDPATNRVAAQFDTRFGEGLALTPGSVWAPLRSESGGSLVQLSSASGRRVGQIPSAGGIGIAASGRQVWTVRGDGTVVRVDGRSGHVEHVWPNLAPGLAADGEATEAIVADHGGAWVVGIAQSTIYRLEGARVARTIEIPADSQPLLAHTGGALWVASLDDRRGHFHLSRIDPDRGDVTAVVDVGRHRPQALVPVAGGLWVVGGDGTAVLIDT